MDLPVENLVGEIDLKPADVLLPLYECVVNAIISLQQSKSTTDKKIQIQIERGKSPKSPNLFNVNTIKSIKVIDNGDGFTSKNLHSYKTAYSRTNKAFGCKGIGRFTVLAAFEKISVESTFYENNEWKKIEFDFDPLKEIVINDQKEEVPTSERKTTVELCNLYNKDLVDSSALSLTEIAEELMTHCLIYYLCDNLPRIEIYEPSANEIVVVNELYEKLSKEKEREFFVKNIAFKCFITKTEKLSNRKNHYAYYCANNRVVGGGKSLAKTNSLFVYPISNNGKLFFLDVYLV